MRYEGRGRGDAMTADGEEAYELLADHRLGRGGVEVKLDKGFAEGTYCVYVEFPDLAERVGFTAAHRQGVAYCERLRAELARLTRHSVGDIEDPSYMGHPRRKRDLELTYLTFPLLTCDSRCHDDGVKEEFRLALLRAGQQWDQEEARGQTRRRHSREDEFRRRLDRLLDGEAYAALDATLKERLLAEVPGLAFPPRGIGP